MQSTPKSTQNEKLEQIRSEYKTLKTAAAASESKSFIKNYVEREAWRFFVEGDRQNEGIEKLVPFFQGWERFLAKKGYKSSVMDIKISDIINLVEPDILPVEQKQQFAAQVKQCLAHTEEKNFDITAKQFCLRDCGWIPFENTEPGYLIPLITSLLELEKTEQKIDADFIQSLHKKATDKVQKLLYETDTSTTKSQPGKFRSETGVRFAIDNITTDQKGIDEILDKILYNAKNLPEHDLFIILSSNAEINAKEVEKTDRSQLLQQIAVSMGKNECRLASRIHTKSEQKVSEVLHHLTSQLLTHYDESIKKAETPEAKIRCIVTLIRDLEQLHPFKDANCRTLCMLLLSKLLMDNGFPPPMLKNPNHFDGYSIDGLVAEVIQGMENTLDMATKRKVKLFDISTDEILSATMPEELHYAASLGITSGQKRKEPSDDKTKVSDMSMFRHAQKTKVNTPAPKSPQKPPSPGSQTH